MSELRPHLFMLQSALRNHNISCHEQQDYSEPFYLRVKLDCGEFIVRHRDLHGYVIVEVGLGEHGISTKVIPPLNGYSTPLDLILHIRAERK